MSSTVRASIEGLERVDRARRKKGWNKTEQAWCDQALTTLPTLKRFWLRKAIQQAAFQGICQVVGIEDWESIVDDRLTDSLPNSPAGSIASQGSAGKIVFSTYDETTWVGRAGLIQTLMHKLQNQCRVLLLTGLTGIGKTAFAERLVSEQTSRAIAAGQPSIRFCSLNFEEMQEQSFVAGGRRLLEEKLKIALSKEELNDAAAILQRFAQIFKTQIYWLQLDSLEVLLVEDEQGGNRFADPTWLTFFRQLLSADCLSYCLLTSQDLPGDLKALASRYPKVWHCQSLWGLTAAEQLALFQRQGIEPASAEDLHCLERISNAYEGHPLVLQVIAGEMLTQFQGDIQAYWQRYRADLEQIDRQFILIQPQSGANVRSRELKHIVRDRVRQYLERLPEAARQMFCASSVYRRPVPVEFWLAMAIEEAETDRQTAFETLQDRYLVEWEGNLIRSHNLTRSVAADLLKLNRSQWERAERIAAHCWFTAYRPTPEASYLERVRGALEAFHHSCAVEDWQAATNILLSRSEDRPNQYELHRQLSIWGYYTEAIQLYNQLLGRSTLQVDALCLNWLGIVHANLSHYEAATDYHQQSLELSRELGDRRQEAIALNGLSAIQFRLGNFAGTVELLQQSLPMAQAVGDRTVEGQALGYLGAAAIALGNQAQAIQYFEQALRIAQEIGDRYGEGAALLYLGSASGAADHHLQAIQYFQQALQITQELGNRYDEQLALRGLGNAYYFLSDYKEAINYYQQSLTLAQTLGNLYETGNALGNLGNICSVLGNYGKAIEYHQQQLRIARELGARFSEAIALGNLGDTHHRLGHFAEALEYLQQALQLCRELGNRRGEAISLGNLGEVYTAIGELTQAIDLNQQSLKLSQEVRDRQNEAVVLGNLGNAYAALGDLTQAIERYQQQFAFACEIGDRRTESRALLNLGKVWIKQAQYREALEVLQSALHLCQTVGDRPTQADILQHLAELHRRENLLEQARQFEEQAAAIIAELKLETEIPS